MIDIAVEIATAYIELIPSARGFSGRLRGELSGLEGVGAAAGASTSSSFGSSFLSGIAGVAKAAAVALGAVGAGAGGYGIKIAAANEQATISFETMLGSAEAAGGFLTQLRDFAARTPFEFPELQTAASSLISVGIDAAKVIPIMTTLGNVTSGMGTGSEGVRRATVALQQMSAAGRITAEDLNQLRDAGIPVFDLLAAATGKTKEQVSELARTGKLGRQELEQLMAALESGAGLERFANLMDRQSQSLLGLVSTMKDTVGQGLAKVMEPAVAQIKAALPEVNQAISDALGTAGPLLSEVTIGLVDLARSVLPIVKDLTPSFVAFVEVLGRGFGDALMLVLPATGDLLRALAPILPVLAGLAATAGRAAAEGLTALLRAVTPLAEALSEGFARVDLGGVLAGIIPPAVDLARSLAPLVDLLVRFTQQALAEVAALGPEAGAAFGALLRSAQPLAVELVRLTQDVLPIAVDAFREMAPVLMRLANVALPLVVAWAEMKVMMWDLKARVLGPLIPIFVKLVEAVLPLLEKVIVPMITKLAEWTTSIADTKAGIVLLGIAMGGVLFAKFAAGLFSLLLPGRGLLGMLSMLGYAMRFNVAMAATEGVTGFSRFIQVLSKTVFGINLVTVAQAALTVVMSPWFLIPAAIAAVAAALFLAYKNIEPFREAVDKLFEAFKVGLGWIKDLFGAIFSGDWSKAGQMVSDMGGAIVDGLATIGNLIRDKAAEWASVAWEWVKMAVPLAAGKLFEIYTAIVSWWVGTALPNIARVFGGIAGAVFGWLQEVLPQVPVKLWYLYLALVDWWINTAIPGIAGVVANLAVIIWDWIKEAAPQAAGKLGELFAAAVAWLTSVGLPSIASAVAGLAGTIWDGLKSAGANAPGAILGFITDVVPQIPGALAGIASAIGSWITNTAVPWVVDRLQELGHAFLGGWLGDVITGAPGKLWELVVAWNTWLYGTAIPWALSKLVDLAGAFVGWIAEIVPQLPGKLWDLIVAWNVWLYGTAIPWALEKMVGLAGAFLGWIGSAVAWLVPKLGEWLAAFGVWILETAIPWVIQKMLDFAVGFLVWIAGAVINLPYELGKFLVGFYTWLYGTAIPWVIEKVAGFVGAFLSWIWGAVVALPGAIWNLLWAFSEFVLLTAIPWVTEKVAGLAGAVLSWLWQAVLDLPANLWGLFLALGDWIVLTAVPWVTEKVSSLAAALLAFVTDAATAIPKKLEEFGSKIIEFITGMPDRITSAAKNLFVGVVNAFLAAANWIYRTWNSLELKIPEAEFLGQKVGGFTLAMPHINEIPYIETMASGGLLRAGQPAIVGEAGPELWWPTTAGTVIPNAAWSSPAAAGLRIDHLEVKGADQPTETAFQIGSELRWLSMQAGGT